MRVLPCLLAAVLTGCLAGCAEAPAPPPEASPEVRYVQPDAVVLTDGTFQWHEVQGGPPLEAYDLASQAVAHPCLWDGAGGEEPYFNNRQVPTGRAEVGAWSGNVTFTIDWTPQDWIGDALRIAYRAPGIEGWQEVGPIERGVDTVERIVVVPPNATADEEDSSASTDWSIWVCLPTDTGNPEQPFVGAFTFKAVFVPDPMPETALVPAETGDGRTARGG